MGQRDNAGDIRTSTVEEKRVDRAQKQNDPENSIYSQQKIKPEKKLFIKNSQ